MDPKLPSQSPPPSDSTHGGAATFLSNLPSRGLFSSTTTPSSTLGCTRVYICDHDTSPPQNQLIKTDQVNILIRSLLIKKHGHVDNATCRKRAAEKSSSGSSDARSAIKRAATGSVDSLQSLTVERLRMMLREKGLSVKGKKDELVARLRIANG